MKHEQKAQLCHLELQLAKKFVKKMIFHQQKTEWRSMNTKMGQIMQLKKEDDPPPMKTFQHPSARIASRINRMRTQRTMFQQRVWKKTFCNQECVPIIGFQCDRCKQGSGGRWSYKWRRCVCTDDSGNQKQMDLPHIIQECTANENIIIKRNKQHNYHVRTSQSKEKKWNLDDLEQLTVMDEGKEKMDSEQEITWQAKLIPINPEMGTARWHHRNNELLFQLRSEFVELMRIQRRPPPKPPPIGDGSRGTKRRESRFTKMKSCKKQRKCREPAQTEMWTMKH